MRGILGAIAALVYAMLGGADVALTEALVGTMLAITLYAVAVRSSLVMRLGVLKPEEQPASQHWQSLLDYLRATLKRYQLRLELVPYTDEAALQQALASKEVSRHLPIAWGRANQRRRRCPGAAAEGAAALRDFFD
jgi:putative multicomponent Na+:H+ antiporter subunit B